MARRVILHSDMNSFYANVECLHRPELAGRPVAVAGDPRNRHGIILAKNQVAKGYGVITAEAIWEACQKCPDLIVLPPNYPLYQRFSREARLIYYSYTNQVEPFGLDEAWLDLTHSKFITHLSGREVAEEIRGRIKDELGITVSIGVSWNKIYAKFGSDYKKPDAVTEITPENYRDIIFPRDVGELLYVGRSTKRKLKSMGILTIGQLAGISPETLKAQLGKSGEVLWIFARGQDPSPVKVYDPQDNSNEHLIKSIGNSMTTPRDLKSYSDVKLVTYLLAESVGMRLREAGFLCNVVGISVRDKELRSFTRQWKIPQPTDLTKELAETALALFRANYDFSRDMQIRSLGIRAMDLLPWATPVQVDIFTDPEQRLRQSRLEAAIDRLRLRYGNNAVRRGVVLGDELMTPLDIKKDNVIHPVGYFQPTPEGK